MLCTACVTCPIRDPSFHCIYAVLVVSEVKKRPSASGMSMATWGPTPGNYLLTGGGRAVDRERDEQLIQLNRAAIKVCAAKDMLWLILALPIQHQGLCKEAC